MTPGIRFAAGEHERIEAACEQAEAAALAEGFALPRRGAMHAAYYRWLVARIRSRSRRRPRHGEVALALLDWARAAGQVELFGLCPIAHALVETHGDGAVDRLSARCPSVAAAAARRDGLAS